MPGRRIAVTGSLIAVMLLMLAAVPASARPTRTAGEAINITEACPRYLSFEVMSQDTVQEPVTIQAFSARPETPQVPDRLLLERTVRLREVEPDLQPLLPDEEDFFGFHRRAVLRWDGGRPAPGTIVLVGTTESGEMFATATVSNRCDTPDLRMTKVSVNDTSITWRVTNPTSEEVWFNAEVLGARPAEVHIGPVPPNGETTFETSRRRGLNIVLLFVGGKLVDLDLAIVR